MERFCDECTFFGKEKSEPLCLQGHRPRFHTPDWQDLMNADWGYKRECSDFVKEKEEVNEHPTLPLRELQPEKRVDAQNVLSFSREPII